MGKNCKSELTSNQKKAIQMLVYDGLTQTEVASRLGLSINAVNGWVNKNMLFIEHYQKEIDKQAQISRTKFKLKISYAADLLFRLAENSENDMVRLNAVKEILSRAESGTTLEDERLKAQIEKIKAETNALIGNIVTPEKTKFQAFEENRRASDV